MNYQQASGSIIKGLGIMSVEDKPALVNMLQRQGSMVTESSSNKDILDAAIKSIKDNKRFREDLKNYFVTAVSVAETQPSGEESNMSGYSNAKGPTADAKKGGGKFWTSVGGFFKGIFTKENTQKAIGIGMDYAAVSLANKAAKSGNQQAIDYERAKAESYAAEAQSRQVSPAGGKNKWIVPVAIIGGVVVLGVVIFLLAKKK